MIRLISLMILVGGFVFVSCALLQAQVLARKLSLSTWEELIAELKPAEMGGVTLVAMEYLNPDYLSLRTDPSERLRLIGGTKGLMQLYVNANVLVALAAHAELWKLDESRTVARLMRGDGLALRRATRQFLLSQITGYGRARDSHLVQVVAYSYYSMAQRLLGLYQGLLFHRLQSLDARVWQ